MELILTNATAMIAVYAALNTVSHFVMVLTNKYEKTDTKIDDKLHKAARAMLCALKATNKIFFSRY